MLKINFAEWLAEQKVHGPGKPKPERRSQIPGVLRKGELGIVLQPIVSLVDGSVFAYEALVRSNAPEYEGPPGLFAEAIDAEVCGALGRAIREMATEACPSHPLFLNVHPNEFDEGWLVQPTDPIFSHDHPVYLEITESVPLSHFELCHSALKEIRSKGVLLAVDDLGAGFSNLKYIADLSPEIVKLDRNLIANLDRDTRLQMLVKHIVALCMDLGALVVAEGLETAREVAAAQTAGAQFGQGFVFARPSYPAPQLECGIYDLQRR